MGGGYLIVLSGLKQATRTGPQRVQNGTENEGLKPLGGAGEVATGLCCSASCLFDDH